MPSELAVLRRWVISLPALVALLFAVGLAPSGPDAAGLAAAGRAGKAGAGVSGTAHPALAGARDAVPVVAKRSGQPAHHSVTAAGHAGYRLAEPSRRWGGCPSTQGWGPTGRGEAYRGRGPPARA